MAPAYDEFEEKRFGKKRRTITESLLAVPRFRRNRRTAAFFALVILLCLYYTFQPSPTRSPFTSETGSSGTPSDPWFLSYNPVLGDSDARGYHNSGSKISFPNLYASLSHSSAAGLRTWNRIVLFVAGDLGAASRLAVIACEMSTFQRVQVHFAFVGPNNISISSFQTMNAVGDDSECKMTFHDARPKFAEQLPEELIELAVKSALAHLNRFLHPQVTFTEKALEEHIILETIKSTTSRLGMSLIELPWNAADDLRWMTRLDSGSLKGR